MLGATHFGLGANASQVRRKITPPAVSPPCWLHCAFPVWCGAIRTRKSSPGRSWGCQCGNVDQWCLTRTHKVIYIICTVPKTANACIRNHTVIPATTNHIYNFTRRKKIRRQSKGKSNQIFKKREKKKRFAQKRSTAAVQIFTLVVAQSLLVWDYLS